MILLYIEVEAILGEYGYTSPPTPLVGHKIK